MCLPAEYIKNSLKFHPLLIFFTLTLQIYCCCYFRRASEGLKRCIGRNKSGLLPGYELGLEAEKNIASYSVAENIAWWP